MAGRHLTAALKGLHWMLWRAECRVQGRSWEPAGVRVAGERGVAACPGCLQVGVCRAQDQLCTLQRSHAPGRALWGPALYRPVHHWAVHHGGAPGPMVCPAGNESSLGSPIRHCSQPGGHPYDQSTSPRLHLLRPSHWALGFHRMNVEGHSDHCSLCLRFTIKIAVMLVVKAFYTLELFRSGDSGGFDTVVG